MSAFRRDAARGIIAGDYAYRRPPDIGASRLLTLAGLRRTLLARDTFHCQLLTLIADWAALSRRREGRHRRADAFAPRDINAAEIDAA